MMPATEKKKFLIIGQGLAGSALAMALLERECEIMVLDDDCPTSASRMAAGLVTPLAGKRWNPCFRQESYLPESLLYYRGVEQSLGRNLFYELPVIRAFESLPERVRFERNKEKKKHWLAEVSTIPEIFNAPMGGVVMRHGGRLDVPSYLAGVRAILGERCVVERFQLNENVKLHGGKVEWRGIEFDKLIFCTGYKGLVDKYFDFLPARPAKGQMLDIEFEIGMGLTGDYILNKGGWITPIGDNIWRAGATYEWDELNVYPTEKAKDIVVDKIKNMVSCKFDILQQCVGVRPIVSRSNPVIGVNREIPTVGIFNGLGSKGVITAWPIAQHFAEYLIGKCPLDSELDMYRSFK